MTLDLHADPAMLALFAGGEHADGGLVTGIYVRARVGERFEAVDVACLTPESFAVWIHGLEADALRRTLALVVGLLRSMVLRDFEATADPKPCGIRLSLGDAPPVDLAEIETAAAARFYLRNSPRHAVHDLLHLAGHSEGAIESAVDAVYAAAGPRPRGHRAVPTFVETLTTLRDVHETITRHYFHDDGSALQQAGLEKGAASVLDAVTVLERVRALLEAEAELEKGGAS